MSNNQSIGLLITIGVIYLFCLGFNIFLTWDFCSNDALNLSRFFVYEVNETAYCYYGILGSVILVLIPVCIACYVIIKVRTNNYRYEAI
jgi:hypothetical protein